MRLRAHAREALRAQGQPRGTPHALGVRPGPTPCKAAAPRRRGAMGLASLTLQGQPVSGSSLSEAHMLCSSSINITSSAMPMPKRLVTSARSATAYNACTSVEVVSS